MLYNAQGQNLVKRSVGQSNFFWLRDEVNIIKWLNIGV